MTERSLFADAPEHLPSPWLVETLAETAPLALAIGNEKARSELLIAPILVEVRRSLGHRVSVFSGVEFVVDAARGLSGFCDFLLSRSPEQIFLHAPVIAVVEAKQENIKGGVSQCAAEMLAVRLFNEQEGHPLPIVYGAVTTGDAWRFMQLAGDVLTIDADLYYLPQIARIIGIFRAMLAPPGAA
jgi:hypothetical protein